MSSLPVWTTEGRAAALRRKARQQIEGAAPAERDRGAGGAQFNLWYGKYNTLRENKEAERAGAKVLRQERCNSYVDAGRTRANERAAVFFCQFFARGVCSNGHECTFFHLVPSAEDCAAHDKNPTTDIFGRERFAEEKNNMGGVGSFFSLSRTLYVAYGAASEALGGELQATFERVFSEWGPLEDVYIVRGKSIAFVRYVFRASAEFAKEAMHNQSLQPPWWPQPKGAPQAEVLNVRWAYDDPNPVAIRRNKRERDEAFADAVRRAEERLEPEQREALRQQRALEEAAAGAPGAAALGSYPTTDGQYGDAPPQELPPSVGHAERVAAPDCFEYDPDDPYYAEEAGDEPPAQRARLEPGPGVEAEGRPQPGGGAGGARTGDGVAPVPAPALAALAGYGSGSEE